MCNESSKLRKNTQEIDDKRPVTGHRFNCPSLDPSGSESGRSHTGIMGINSYYWVLDSSAFFFTETSRKAMQWWMEVGMKGQHFFRQHPRIPGSGGCSSSRGIKGWGCITGGGIWGMCLHVWSNSPARLGALHVWMSTASSQSLHSTEQHHLNLHSHLVICLTKVVS